MAFETFGDKILENAVEGAKQFVMAKNPCWISFVGSSGTGKTMLANLTFAAKLKAKPSLQYHETLTNGARIDFWPEVATSLRQQDFWRTDAVINARIVLLDEIAVEHDPSGFLKDKLAEILSRRVGKWTILTSNLTMKALGALDTRIPSRMIRDGSMVFDMSTKDYALRRK